MRKILIQLLLVITVMGACKKPYEPEVVRSAKDVLIVEGFINTGIDSTIFMLSRTVKLNDSSTSNPVTKASVFIESDANDKFLLPEIANGKYASPNLGLSQNKKYRIRIINDGNEYVSEFVESKVAPEIESLDYEITDDRIKISANTRDEKMNSRYYKWEYEESWEVFANFNSTLIFDFITNKVIPRDMNTQNIFKCYAAANSTNIIINNSLKLNEDVINEAPITEILGTSERLHHNYSMLLKQKTLTKEAYEFWENLKKITESAGSIFDVTPFEISGNIKNVKNPNEPVIGFISAGTISKKRFFIKRDQLPSFWENNYPVRCHQDPYLYIKNPNNEFPLFYVYDYMPQGYIIPIAFVDPSYIWGAIPICVDCRLRGSTVKPNFWP